MTRLVIRDGIAPPALDFLAWCAGAGGVSITAVQPLHVVAWVERQTHTHAAPTVKQRLAAIRHLFDWLVSGQIIPHNPAASVRRQGESKFKTIWFSMVKHTVLPPE
ncbi:hypothetical protein LMG28727_03496 [Paraburkholderia kirstenboschensis]|nr:hypothetical protein LMG28727_03496 [Paraburkholderia kirstenboschensis]